MADQRTEWAEVYAAAKRQEQNQFEEIQIHQKEIAKLN